MISALTSSHDGVRQTGHGGGRHLAVDQVLDRDIADFFANRNRLQQVVVTMGAQGAVLVGAKQRLRAKRAELAGLRNEHAALLRRYAAAEDAALAHDWPGNVRELRNRVERAVALACSPWIMPGDLFPEVGRWHDGDSSELASLAEVKDAAERRQILRAWQVTNGQVMKAAELLGVSRTTLWEKMRRLKVEAGSAAG